MEFHGDSMEFCVKYSTKLPRNTFYMTIQWSVPHGMPWILVNSMNNVVFHGHFMEYFTWSLMQSPWKIAHSRFSSWNSMGYITGTVIPQDRQ